MSERLVLQDIRVVEIASGVAGPMAACWCCPCCDPGVHVLRVDRPEDAAETVIAAASLAFDSRVPVAVLLSQRLIGAKVFVK